MSLSPEMPSPVQLRSIEVDFSGEGFGNNNWCGSNDVFIDVRQQNGRRICTFPLGDPEKGK